MKASDVGKKCTDSSQCKVYCQASGRGITYGTKVVGYCNDYTQATCSQEVENGIAKPERCQ